MIHLPSLPWDDKAWQGHLRDSVKSTQELAEMLDLSTQRLTWISESDFPLFVPKNFIRRMEIGNPQDPLLRQIVPIEEELRVVDGFSVEPLNESKYSPSTGLIQKYYGRVLVITSSVCPVHCRYCFRRHFPYKDFRGDSLSRALDYVAADQSIQEVILSGGDPLSVRDSVLENFIQRLEHFEHVRILRFHTRFPIMIPQRITSRLLECFEATSLNIVVVVHANHANEIDQDVETACVALLRSRVQILNQSVLLKGVNDSHEALVDLSYRLADAKISPYYLHLLDRVQGAAHFEVSEARAKALVGEMQQRLPGYLVPRLVREEPSQLSKNFVQTSGS